MNNTQAEPAYGGNMRAVASRGKGDTVTTKQAAVILGCARNTVNKLHSTGALKHVATQQGRGGPHYLFLREDVVAFGQSHKIQSRARRSPVAAKPAAKTPKKLDTRIVDDPEIHGRIARLVKLLEASNSPFEATITSVTRAALRIGLTQLEKEAKS